MFEVREIMWCAQKYEEEVVKGVVSAPCNPESYVDLLSI
jgi:hypothetical protein